MATIGALNVDMSLSTAAFEAGADRVANRTRSMHSGVSLGSAAMMGAVSGGVTFALDAVTNLAGSVLSTVTGLTNTITEGVKKQFEAIGAIQDVASSTGFAAAAIIGYGSAAAAAGIKQEGLNGLLEKFSKSLGEARYGADEAGRASAAAFVKLGISTRDLENASPDKVFERVIAATDRMADPLERINTLTAIFGKQGVEAAKFTSDALKQSRADANAFGLSISNIQVAQIDNAGDAVGRVEKLLDGVYTQIAVNVAPIIEYAATKLVNFGVMGDGVGNTVKWAFEKVMHAAGIVADWMAGWVGYGAIWGSLFARVAAVAIDNLGGVAKGAEYLLSLFGVNSDSASKFFDNLSSAAKTAAKAYDLAGKTARDAFHNSTASKWIDEQLKAADQFSKKNAQQAADQDRINGLKRSGIDSAAAKQAQADADKQAANAKRIKDEEDVASRLKKQNEEMDRQAGRIKEGLKTPAMKLAEDLEEARQLFVNKKLTQDEYNQYVQKMQDDFKSKNDPKDPQQAAEAAADPNRRAAAVSQRFAIQIADGGITKQQLDEAKKTNGELGEIKDILKSNRAVEVGID